MEDARTPVQRYRARKAELWAKRSSYDPVCKELAEYISPRSGRFSTSEKNKADKKHQKIFDSTATGAWLVLQSGLSSGLSNKSATWLRLATPDPDLNKSHSVKVWLEDAAQWLLRVFRESNTYAALDHYYGEMALFGTACGVILEDDENVIHHYPLTFGQYALATDDKGQVNTMVRVFSMTVAQMVKRWGEKRVSQNVLNQFSRKNFEQEITVCHLVEPRMERDESKMDGKNMPFRSVYFEEGGENAAGDGILQEKGYRTFPVVAPRWRTVGANTYGESPAMDAINPIKRLQKMTLTEGKAAAYQAEPVVQMPPGLKNQPFHPGARIEVPVGQEITAVWQPTSRINELDILLQRVQREIEARFFKPLFTAISDVERQITAYQAREITGERLAQVGPTIGRTDRELLARLVDITLGHGFDRGELPPAPPEMEGMEIRTELIGVLAQAQKASGAQTSDALQLKIQSMAQTDPSIRHIWDGEHDVRQYADTIGADPRNLRTPEQYQDRVEKEAQAQAAQAQSAVVAEQAGAANQAAQAVATEQQA